MVTNDSLSDLVVRIKNGYLSHTESITLPWSRVKEAVLAVLKKTEYISDYEHVQNDLVIKLRYKGQEAAIVDIKRVSKPGVRIYAGVSELNKITKGLGYAILSTPGGIMTHREAKKLNMGGEIICKVW
jgi:small subunit ribosomal protein S8